MYAVSLLLSGMNEDDNEAFTRASKVHGITLPEQWVEGIRGMTRPRLATIYLENEAVTKTPITAAAIGLAKVFFTSLKSLPDAPPAGSPTSHLLPNRFFELHVLSTGKLDTEMWPTTDLLRAGGANLEHVVRTFLDRLAESPSRFQEWLTYVDVGRIRLTWAAPDASTGIAAMYYEKQDLLHTLLLLSGRNLDADRAAVHAFEETCFRGVALPDY